jgi:hypothetical protein
MTAMRLGHGRIMLAGLLGVVSCTPTTTERNPFLGYTEEFGVAGQQEVTPTGQAGGTALAETFRNPLTLTFVNNHASAILDTSFVAWVNVSSVRSAGQQDALLRGGYVQLTSEVRLGSAFVLPVGTFVYAGPGTAGATPVHLGKAAGTPTTQGATTTTNGTSIAFNLITPDTVLMFSQPPVSCDSVAFTFSDPVTDEVLGGASTAGGGYKTLAQVQTYECSPLKPGLFFTSVGGERNPDEFREGESLTFTFESQATDGDFALVTIETPSTP